MHNESWQAGLPANWPLKIEMHTGRQAFHSEITNRGGKTLLYGYHNYDSTNHF
ncbi:MAG: hypothetical protein IPL67_09210 [Ignavibacteria bacterium]|nr:hypothetical protein [Ignavibacteria bacterium]